MKFKICALVAAFAAVTSSASANLLGQNYASAELGYIHISGLETNVDGGFASVGGNLVLQNTDNYGVDMSPTLGYAKVSAHGQSIRAQTAGSTFRGYLKTAGVQPFAEAGLGYAWEQYRGVFHDHFDTFVWGLGVGVQIPLSDTLTFIYAVNYTRVDKIDDGGYSFRFTAHKWLSETVGLSLNYSVTEGPGNEHRFSPGVTVRF